MASNPINYWTSGIRKRSGLHGYFLVVLLVRSWYSDDVVRFITIPRFSWLTGVSLVSRHWTRCMRNCFRLHFFHVLSWKRIHSFGWAGWLVRINLNVCDSHNMVSPIKPQGAQLPEVLSLILTPQAELLSPIQLVRLGKYVFLPLIEFEQFQHLLPMKVLLDRLVDYSRGQSAPFFTILGQSMWHIIHQQLWFTASLHHGSLSLEYDTTCYQSTIASCLLGFCVTTKKFKFFWERELWVPRVWIYVLIKSQPILGFLCRRLQTSTVLIDHSVPLM